MDEKEIRVENLDTLETAEVAEVEENPQQDSADTTAEKQKPPYYMREGMGPGAQTIF